MKYRQLVLRNRKWIFRWTFGLQWFFALTAIACGIFGLTLFLWISILLSIGSYILLASYTGVIKKDFQETVARDYFWGVPGRRKRTIWRKLKRQGEVKKFFDGDL
jgi:hypothetical protein